MELQRTILVFLLIILSLLLWTNWQKEHTIQQIPTKAVTTQAISPSISDTTENGPSAPAIGPSSVPAPAVSTSSIKTAAGNSQAQLINVKTDVLSVKINPKGGDIVGLQLLQYPAALHSQTPTQLFTNDPQNYYVAQSALMGTGGPDTPQSRAVYQSSSTNYNLANNNEIAVTLSWIGPNGLVVNKIFTFHKGSYLIDMSYNIENKGTSAWQGNLISQLTRKDAVSDHKGMFQVHPYIGAAISSPNQRYQEISFKKMSEEPIDRTITDGWLAMVQHYFLSAWVPEQGQPYQYFSDDQGNQTYTIGLKSSPITVAPGQSTSTSLRLYSGPEVTDVLSKIAPGLNLTVSYGWLWPISVVIFSVMKWINQFVHNWGWSIVIVTILIKIVFYPFSTKSYRSMAGMRKIQPKIEALKEKHGEDRQKFSQSLMELYKEEKMNPLGGCLPILIQIPVFFALYMVIVESVEFRQAPWIGWIQDLSSPDPYFILPILMGITMFIQQKLNPPPPDPTQAKVMMFLPVVFVILFVNFPAGLVLYWVVNNTLSIMHQWYTMREFERNYAKK